VYIYIYTYAFGDVSLSIICIQQSAYNII
jgi:hypothetical protein